MRLNQLQFLVELKKQGSISKAAQHLFIAQPSLSAALKELEDELGFQVVKRSKKGVSFTPLGELVLEKALLITREVDEIKNIENPAQSHLRGRVFVGGVPFVCNAVLLDVMIHLKSRHPEMIIRLEENDAPGIIRSVAKKELDLGVIMVCNSEEDAYFHELRKHKLVFTELFQDEMCFWVGPLHSLRQRETVKMAEILQYPYISYKDSLNQYDRLLFAEFMNSDRLQVIQINDRDSVKKYIIKSQATTAMPFLSAADQAYLKEGLWLPLKISDCRWTSRIGWIRPENFFAGREETAFIAELQAVCAMLSP